MVRLSAIGDVVNTLHSLSALRSRYPEAYIAWLVEDKARAVLDGHPYVDEIFVFESKTLQKNFTGIHTFPVALEDSLSFVRVLRARRFDFSLDFQGNLKSGILIRLANARIRIGYDRRSTKEMNFLFNNHHVLLKNPRIHRVERHFSLLTALGIMMDTIPDPVFPLPEAVQEFADEYLRRVNPDGLPVIILHPGTSEFGTIKRWPAPFFGRLADMLLSRYRAIVLVTYGPGEEPRAGAVVNSCGHHLYMPATGSLSQLAGLIRKASLFIAADTGPVHIAAAMKVPVVALFGPKDPVIYGPYSTPREIIQPPLPCQPCGRRSCDDPACMTAISPEEVFEGAVRLIERQG
jgi:heptosyltransferase-1